MMRITNARKIGTKRRHGSTLVEFALIVPILITILLGIIEFGWYVKNQLTIANATREGARVAAIGATQQAIKDRVVNAAKPSMAITATNVTLGYAAKTTLGETYGAFPADNNTTSPATNGATSGDYLQVTTSVPHSTLTGFPFLRNRQIRIVVTMVRE